MPWMESSVMDERLRLVARLLDGNAMTDMCRAPGISRRMSGMEQTHQYPADHNINRDKRMDDQGRSTITAVVTSCQSISGSL